MKRVTKKDKIRNRIILAVVIVVILIAIGCLIIFTR